LLKLNYLLKTEDSQFLSLGGDFVGTPSALSSIGFPHPSSGGLELSVSCFSCNVLAFRAASA